MTETKETTERRPGKAKGLLNDYPRLTKAINVCIAVLLLLVLVIVLIPRKKEYPICSDCVGKEISLTDINPSTQINLRKDCWSVKIVLPPKRPFRLDVTEELHGVRWNGKILDRDDLVELQKKMDGWFGRIPYRAFRFRGTGKLTITLE